MKTTIAKLLIVGCLASVSMFSAAHDANMVQSFAPKAAGSSVKVDETNPYQMIRAVADVTFKRFANEQTAIQTNPNILKDIVREELVPYIDYRYSALKAMGFDNVKTYRKDKEQLGEFVLAFRDYLIASYAQVFTLYKNQQVEFEPERDFANEKVVAVRTTVIEAGREPIDISFRVRKNKKSGEWKAYDMVAEGISLLDSKQAELSGLIRQKGLQHVTEMLREKANKDIVFK